MSYRRPVLRPVRCSTRKEPSSTPCSGEPSSMRTSGLPILVRAGGGTDRFRVLVIAQHLLPITLSFAGRRARANGHLYGEPGGPATWCGAGSRGGGWDAGRTTWLAGTFG